jgi:DNA replication protein DnaC
MKAPVENLEKAAVEQQCRVLRLPAVAEQCGSLAEVAVKQRQTYLCYLEALLTAELEERERNTIARRLKEARLPRLKTLEEFDFSKAPQVSATQIQELAQGGYIERAEPVILIGDCGTGKTHLLTGLCVAACRQKRRVRFATAAALVNELVEAKQQLQLRRVLARWERYDLIAIDEVGYVPMADLGAEFLFQVIAERAEKAAVILTTNLPFSEWTQVIPNPRLCKALLESQIVRTSSRPARTVIASGERSRKAGLRRQADRSPSLDLRLPLRFSRRSSASPTPQRWSSKLLKVGQS